jgi:methylaspartate mutase epsilon subunit
VSYNLPYSRASLGKTVPAWREAADFWARSADRNRTQTHIETFGGALLGQLCPPSLLVAVSTLEALFFAARGIQGVSLSLAQGSSFDQDVGALIAMDRIIDRRLATIDTHKVFYTFMGQFPVTPVGAEALIRASARIAAIGGAERLIVKTAAEARGIPTVEENVTALGWARESADESQAAISADAQAWADCIEAEAECMIEAVLNLSPDVGDALIGAFASGLLDVPYCMHPDNRGQTRATVDPQSGAVVWTCTGALPIAAPKTVRLFATEAEKSAQFERAIEAVRRLYDDAQNSHEIMETE